MGKILFLFFGLKLLNTSVTLIILPVILSITTKYPSKETVIKKFTDVFELWKRGRALEIEEIKKNDDEYHFNVTRCKYAEMYNEMGLKDIGQLLSCNRDYNFSVGFDKNLILERKKTIMEGHSCCTFRYSNKKKT